MLYLIYNYAFVYSGVVGCFMSSFTLAIELVGPEYRTLVGIGMDIPFAVGEALAGVLAIFLTEWRSFQYISSIPIFVMLLIYFVIEESPRWLITKQKYKELNKVVNKIAKVNKVEVPEDIILSLSKVIVNRPPAIDRFLLQFRKSQKRANKPSATSAKHNSILQLVSHPVLRRNTLVMFANWIIVVLG